MLKIMRRWVPLMLWLATCAAAMVALWSVEEARFDPPPSSPGAWSQWASGRDVLDATAGISRLIATIALGYLLLVSVAHLFALAWGPVGLHRFTARLSPTPVAALAATAVLGGSPLAAAMGTPGSPPTGNDDPAGVPAPVMRVIEDDPPQPTTVPTTTRPANEPPVDVSSGEGPRAEPTPGGATAPLSAPTSDTAHGGTSGGGSDAEHTVAQGENFWSIARQQVRLGLGREPTEAEIRSYWLALMDLNAARMVEPGNPDLLRPGQELRLPG